MWRLTPIVFLAALAGACNPQASVRDLNVLQGAQLHTFSERQTDLFLRWFAEQPLSTTDRVVALARKNIGQPYRLGLLGEYPFEIYDPQPMVCLSASDCVTFVEQTYAMALAHDWASFFRALERIRYRDGHIGLLNRNHFMEADWNVNNAWLFKDITAVLPEADPQPMWVRVDRAALLARYGIATDLPVEVVRDSYIPRGKVGAVLNQLRDGDMIEIVRGGEHWQYVGHVGILAHGTDGRVTMLHSGPPAVREEPLEDYLQTHGNVRGVKILRMAETGEDAEEGSPLPDHQVVRAGVDEIASPREGQILVEGAGEQTVQTGQHVRAVEKHAHDHTPDQQSQGHLGNVPL
jgi:hypothetical protein